MAEVKIKYGRS